MWDYFHGNYINNYTKDFFVKLYASKKGRLFVFLQSIKIDSA